MNTRTAREIIIDLIDRKEITGEEAYTLIYELVNKTTWTYPSITSSTPYGGSFKYNYDSISTSTYGAADLSKVSSY